MKRPHLFGSVAVLVLASVVLVAPTPAQADGTDPTWATCAQYTVPVTLSGDATVYHVTGRLCTRSDPLRGAKTVHLLVSGFTYDHNYWNPGYKPNSYSWVWSETSQGYSTFNIDRLGTGLSDHPPAAELTAQNEALEIKQIIQALRAGTVGGIHFQIVVGVGHSLGAGILQYEAGTVTGAGNVPDYLILADFLTATNTQGANEINATIYPASQDPKFSGAGLPTGYETTEPGTRGADFYHTQTAEASMISSDESSKSTGTAAETSVFGLARQSSVTHAIHVPTLIAVGQFDKLDCNEAIGLSCADDAAVMARESGNFSATACLETYVLAGAGHDTDLHIGAGNLFNEAANWLNDYTVNFVNQKDANGCIPMG